MSLCSFYCSCVKKSCLILPSGFLLTCGSRLSLHTLSSHAVLSAFFPHIFTSVASSAAFHLELFLLHSYVTYLSCRPAVRSALMRLLCTCLRPPVASLGGCPMRRVFRSSASRSHLAPCVAGASLGAGPCHPAARLGCGLHVTPLLLSGFFSGKDSTQTALWPCIRNIFAS